MSSHLTFTSNVVLLLFLNLFKTYFPQVGNICLLEVIGNSTWNNIGNLLVQGLAFFLFFSFF